MSLEGVDFLCSFGLNRSLYSRVRPWLDEDPRRRLVFVEDRPAVLAQLHKEEDAIVLLNDLRVKIHFLDSPLQIEPVAKKIGWSAAFRKMEIVKETDSPHFPEFCACLRGVHLAAELILSDAVDWGCAAMQSAKRNLARPFRSALRLEGAFRKVPAIIVGAGPSLEKNRHLLEQMRGRALICAGGNAIAKLSFPPHFAAAIDPKEPLGKSPFPQVPFCFQSRLHPDSLAGVQGEALLAPDSHFSFLNWIAGDEALFDGGWTVGNFLTALAIRWGCDPIVFVGMDHCYQDLRKYADGVERTTEGLVQAAAQGGKTVWTQSDWLMAIRWTEEMAGRQSAPRFINATGGGMGMALPVETRELGEIEWQEIPDLQGRVDRAIRGVPLESPSLRWEEWENSLRRCSRKICEEEIAYQQLLSPLWRIWKPLIERELDLDSHPDKLRINEQLFYNRIIQEHLHVLE